MDSSVIRVPFDLLLHPELTPSAKLLWMLQAAQSRITTRKVEPGPDSGLFRHTVRKASRQLQAAGWTVPQSPEPVAPAAWVPFHLLIDRRVSALARVLYGVLQAVPKYCAADRTGRFTYMALRRLTGAGINTLKRAIDQLVQAEWMQITQKRQRAPYGFVLYNPQATAAAAWVQRARRRIRSANHKGEAIMKEFLSLLIDSDNFQDNTKQSFLLNPMTGELMEFDRFYRPSVAFEFQGPQHYGNTELYSGQAVANQQGRDLMKKGICTDRCISLVPVRREDLSLQEMSRKVGSQLPLRDLTGLDKVVAFLEDCASSHRAVPRYANR